MYWIELTNDGNYDIENNRLVNVNKPEYNGDVVIYSLFVRNMNEMIEKLADHDQRLESLRNDNDERKKYLEEVKRNVRLNTAALEFFKNEQNNLNVFFRINVWNKVFTGVANNTTVKNKKYI